MLHLAFCGFRHGLINDLYRQAMEDPNVEVLAAFEENDEARADLMIQAVADATM